MLIHEQIITENLIGIEISLKHKNDVFEIFSNPASIRYTDNEVQHSVLDAEKLILKFQDEFRTQQSVRWGITLKNKPKIIGILSLYHIDFKHRFATLGCLMSEAYQGKKLMPEMQKAAFRWAFETLNLNRIEAQCFVGNVHSIKNLESVGMIREGRLRQNFLIYGRYEDSYLYGLTRSDFFDSI